ncbi:MAG: hypothetical protein PHU82_00450 [Candidatus Pacebacteria bacterium]|jgi:hypothetical protein|nr:hypothetical protein [Candidatus Paceibacterota bacterium]MDD4994447.1 hypothetical protein [Candidatus Paceibacterota bacterium]
MNALKEGVKEIVIAERFIRKFIEKQYSFFSEKKLKTKVKEILIGYEGINISKGKIFVITRLPEGIKIIIDEKGNFRDFDEFFLLRR